ncbi:hypothetical protein RRF57_000593 [Xylaria bambusicola]|uniref:Uncharacterized protein n=1 Tax=Xylaria bambusicola TaxID=326684 RepID=A0AAN7Z0U2_9PEZI
MFRHIQRGDTPRDEKPLIQTRNEEVRVHTREVDVDMPDAVGAINKNQCAFGLQSGNELLKGHANPG